MNQIAIKDEMSFDLILKDVEQTHKLCAALMKTKHFAAIGEVGMFAIVQKAKLLNINPLYALNGALYYVQGKVGMGAELMNAFIREAGHSITKDLKSNDTICILHGKRKDNGDNWVCSFSLDDAKRAGLLKNMFDKYPSIMLYNRAMSMLARQLFPDVIKGAGYTIEELMEIKHPNLIKLEDVQEIKQEDDKISLEERVEIKEILDLCDPAYVKKVWESLNKSNAYSIEEIPCSLFLNLKKAALKNKQNYQSLLLENEMSNRLSEHEIALEA